MAAPTRETPEEITVRCPACGVRYRDWTRPSAPVRPDDPVVSVCPGCGYPVAHDTLRPCADDVWETIAVDEDTPATES